MKLSCRTVPSLVALLAALVPWGLLCPVGCTGPRAAERAADRRPESSVRRAPSGGVETPFDEKDSAGSRPEHSAPAHSPAPPAAGPAEPGTTIAGGDEESKASDRSGGKPAPGTGYDFAGSFVEGETIRPAAPAPPPSAAPLSREETAKKEHAPAKAPPASPPARRSPAPASPRVQAGYADDNKQFNHFLDYLRGASSLDHLPLDVSNRIRITLLDERGKSVPNCLLSLRDPGGKLLQERRSYADGRVLLFPSEEAALQVQGLKLSARCLEQTQELVLDPHGLREHQLRYPAARPSWERVPLDVAFLIDTTGSMGDEIARLKATLEVIHFQITHMSSSPEVRFGMVLYRDQGDDYRTRVVPFTGDVEAFQRELAKVEAGGGGDGPEDLQEGLARAFGDLRWNEQGVRLLFLLADAQPH
ncbi:MAG: VWA domain-containing protein, partial [Deltaproteobacteria bacterium]|nr:VWA domain-containing protein [Deltaproteobacteria bacterium]